MTFTQALAAFAADPVRIPPEARRIAALSALDWLAVGRAGAAEPVARIVRDLAQQDGGSAMAHVFGGGRVPSRAAALVNGTISHALDYDDTHFAHIGHPSVAIFPAALAIGEAQRLPLARVQEAALIGMELSVRVGLWLGRGHYQIGFHQTATAGAFGATAAAGRLLGLDPARMAQALGLTATRAAGLKAQFGTMGKPYNAGLAAATGTEIALLIAAGFEANAEAMEGAHGFAATHHGAEDAAAALQGLGSVWLMEEVSHKFHACCHGLHAALEAARALDLAAPEIAEITIRTHPRWMSVCNQPAPTTGLGAKFSYATVLAMTALGHDTARLESYSDRICADPRVQDLRDRVTVVADEALSETEAVLSVLRRDGVRRDATHDLAVPLSMDLREARIRQKAAALMGPDRVAAASALLEGDGDAADFGALMAEADGDRARS
jgi:2-methylcitrate dehydratase PrpD